MSKTKKSYKSNDTESKTSEESSNNSESEEEFRQKRERKKRKQKDKKKKKHRKLKSAKKKSKHNSPAEDNFSDSTAESTSSSEEDSKVTKKNIKKESDVFPNREKRGRSHSHDRDKHNSKSKWESPLRRAKSRSGEKYRNERSRSREKQKLEESHGRNRDFERYQHSSRDREREERMGYRARDKDQRGSYDKRERSPGRVRERSRERNRERNNAKHETRSINRNRSSGSRFRNQRSEDNSNYQWGKASDNKKPIESDQETKEKEKPNFGLSGALTEDTNKVNGIVIKYSEPPEARKPKRRWRLYPFKGETALPVMHIHRQSCFLVGRDRKVADLAVDHPSCSKQHAALQYRLVSFKRDDGSQGKRVRLYLIDLESANGTFLNNKRIDARKYYELMEKDVIKFGFSTREYVLLHENSKEDQEDDDIEIKEEIVDN